MNLPQIMLLIKTSRNLESACRTRKLISDAVVEKRASDWRK